MHGYCALYLDRPESLGLEALRATLKKTKIIKPIKQFIYMFVNTMELDPK